MRKIRKCNFIWIIGAICIAAGFTTGCAKVGREIGGKEKGLIESKEKNININNESSSEEKTKTDDKKSYEEIRISAVGDILVHETQLRSQYDHEKKEYDFTNNFKFVKPYISSADIAIANLETTLAGSRRKYTGYPVFNSPDAIADALKEAGFDIITTANNHIIDSGAEGVIRTGEVLRSKGFDVIGTKKNKDDKGYVVKEIKGIKIALTNYTFETARKDGVKTLNSIPVPKEVEPLIDTFNYGTLSSDLAGMRKRIDRMRGEGADIIVFCMHWGDEYQRHPNNLQRKIAQELSNFGVDIIIGGHPHVIQPIEVMESGVSNKNTLVVYSLGNFLSNQCYERLNNRYPEDGLIVNIFIRKDLKTGGVSVESVSYVPTWVHRKPKGDLFVYEILPLIDALENKTAYDLINEDSIWRAENSHASTVSLLETTASRVASIPITEHKGISVIGSK
jgi:poly-gamma-glutamate capsule biosynthesis protein CapA/YwtB (metallophosphatase superfamily)